MSFNNTITNSDNPLNNILFYIFMIPFFICGGVIVIKFIIFILQFIFILILNLFYKMGIEKCNPDLWFKEHNNKNLRIIETKTYKYDENKLNENKDFNCSICLEKFNLNDEIVVLSCNHEFHRLCAKEWSLQNIGKKQTCPNCRNNLKYLIV